MVKLWTERKKDRVAMTAEQTSWTEALVGPIGFSVGHVPELNPKRPDAMMTSRKHRTAEAPGRNFNFPPRKRRNHSAGKPTSDDDDASLTIISLLTAQEEGPRRDLRISALIPPCCPDLCFSFSLVLL